VNTITQIERGAVPDLNQTALRVEVDRGSTSAKGRPPGRVWLVKLRRGNCAVIIAVGLARPCADHLAAQINQLLHPSEHTTGQPR
jgi:hypothetical protein